MRRVTILVEEELYRKFRHCCLDANVPVSRAISRFMSAIVEDQERRKRGAKGDIKVFRLGSNGGGDGVNKD